MIRKKIIVFWGTLAGILLALWLLCFMYKSYWGNSDGLIKNIVYKNVFEVLFILIGLGFILSIGLTVQQKIIQNLTLAILSSLFFIVLVELAGHLVISLKLVQSSPFVFRRFYISPAIATLEPYPAGDLNPITGRGHVSNSSYNFKNCIGDSIHWHFNSEGANDQQRTLINSNPTKKRIAIVGDSFSEGYMVNTRDRYSTILERKTQLEHLNFAVNGSNPLNYYLTYKSIAKAYAPDILIVGVLPANDFETNSEDRNYTYVDWPTYIPYWQGTYPNYKLRYSLANVSQSIFYGHHTPASLLKVIDSVYTALPLSGKVKADLLAHSSIFRLLGESEANAYKQGELTKYEQFSDEEWHVLTYSLTNLMQEAKGKKVIILSIPTLWDLKALKKGKTNRLDPLLATLCQQNGVEFIPLIPSFLAYKGNLEQLYVTCDGHWSKQGESFAAELLIHHPIYRAALGLP